MRRLPLFVLPTVLFPGALMPLHVFEPRYRQMIARCLEGDKRFGLVYHDSARDGAFELREGQVGCVAEILQFKPLPDGRSLILARGEQRFRVHDGIESNELYHEALIDDYMDRDSRLVNLVERRQQSIDLYQRALRRLYEFPRTQPFDTARDASFQIAGGVVVNPAWQQMLLEMTSEQERLDEIDTILRAVVESD